MESALKIHGDDPREPDGYRGALVYRAVDQSDGKDFVLIILEFAKQGSNKVEGLAARIAEHKILKEHPYSLRDFHLLGSEGFEAECRMPARL